jgi:hypothetical protein
MPRPEFEFQSGKHKYYLDGIEYPSVTTIIRNTVPKDLSWWGMTVGVNGLLTLIYERGYSLYGLSTEECVAALTTEKLTTNHMMQRGGTRGSAIHRALEKWATEQKVLELEEYTEEEHPYMVGLARFLVENDPEIYESEVITGSREYKYAGTFDLKCRCRKGTYKGKGALLDLKTGKRVYSDQYFPQLEAYEYAERESGEDPADIRCILQLCVDGTYEIVESTDTFDDFRVLLQHYQSIQDRKQRVKLGVMDQTV